MSVAHRWTELRIATTFGPSHIPGITHGAWGYYQLHEADGVYAITHVATGYNCGYTTVVRDALTAIAELNAAYAGPHPAMVTGPAYEAMKAAIKPVARDLHRRKLIYSSPWDADAARKRGKP